ncbi:UdgX family uracil-DNA binding protein [Pelagibacterium montanilacus]|uniref:UdgX family uracil-DNA binding protein n=1 Tax=Pelagibacterium montanilacus TaxID=2185280 RepID=UPI000F8D96C9|nr:UdgX family uracil-DNA binding protein [Pelagibacterium montanilacus]
MHAVTLTAPNDLDQWREPARRLLAARVPPDAVDWRMIGREGGLFDALAPEGGGAAGTAPVRVPRRFLELAETAICHSDPGRFGLLYRIAFRLQADRTLLEVASDADVRALDGLIKAVRRDSHKMKAFVRFRALDETGAQFAAWYEPDHYVLERTAPFFAERFAGMGWAILTPYRSVFWDGTALGFGPGARRSDVPETDAMEDVWRTYFRSIFNPARLKVKAMTAEMPRKFWRNLPEADLVPELIRQAQSREAEMIARKGTEPPRRHARMVARKAEGEPSVPAGEDFATLEDARAAAQACQRCPLFENATRTVFGEGSADAPIMVIGEQPGDSEDLAGRPFVGPAGRVLDAAMEEAGFERAKAYVTNAVKHFKFVPRGKRRLHQKPDGGEIAACRFWLEKEMALVRPRVVLALGASAAQALLGRTVTISKVRGKPLALPDGTPLMVAVHPSYILRLPDPAAAEAARAGLVADLAAAWSMAMDHGERAQPLDTGRRAP